MKKTRVLISAITFIFLAVICLCIASLSLRSYDNYPKFKPFFNDKDTEYDVYFFGASNALNGIFPMQLWKEHKITSYNFAWHKSTIALDYWLLRLASKMHKPKIVFIDIFGIDSELKVDPNLYYAHGALDLFPLSKEKILALNDIFDGNDTKTEFLLPFYLYHNSWKKTNFSSIKSNISRFILTTKGLLPTKGGELRTGLTSPERFNITVNDFAQNHTTSFKYAEKIVSYCKENDIIPVFMLVPYPTQENMAEWKDFFISQICSDGTPFLDMTGLVDFDTDKFDRFAHLNPLGAEKVTGAIGKYISENLAQKAGLEKSDAERAKWNDDYGSYKKFYDAKITEAKTLSGTLTLMSNSDYRAELSVSEKAELDKNTMKILASLSENIKVHFSKADENKIEMSVFTKSGDGSQESLLCKKKFSSETIKIQ